MRGGQYYHNHIIMCLPAYPFNFEIKLISILLSFSFFLFHTQICFGFHTLLTRAILCLLFHFHPFPGISFLCLKMIRQKHKKLHHLQHATTHKYHAHHTHTRYISSPSSPPTPSPRYVFGDTFLRLRLVRSVPFASVLSVCWSRILENKIR